jgi:hypothetical protein
VEASESACGRGRLTEENIGDTLLTFTTVEDKRSPNAPLPL